MHDLKEQKGVKFTNTLQLLRIEGESQVLRDLVGLLLEKDKQECDQILAMLSDLHDSSSIEEMMTILRDQEYSVLRPDLLGTVWNSKLNYSYYLPEFVEIAVDGNFMEALDCLTIIENMEGPFEERHILESQLHLKDYLEDNSPKELQKAKIMSEIALLLKELSSLDEEDISSYLD